jgi:hypothetical protein
MVFKSATKFSVSPKKGPNNKTYYSPRIYLPTKLVDDSTFPFKDGEELIVRINGRKLIITKKPKTRNVQQVNEQEKDERSKDVV